MNGRVIGKDDVYENRHRDCEKDREEYRPNKMPETGRCNHPVFRDAVCRNVNHKAVHENPLPERKECHYSERDGLCNCSCDPEEQENRKRTEIIPVEEPCPTDEHGYKDNDAVKRHNVQIIC